MRWRKRTILAFSVTSEAWRGASLAASFSELTKNLLTQVITRLSSALPTCLRCYPCYFWCQISFPLFGHRPCWGLSCSIAAHQRRPCFLAHLVFQWNWHLFSKGGASLLAWWRLTLGHSMEAQYGIWGFQRAGSTHSLQAEAVDHYWS